MQHDIEVTINKSGEVKVHVKGAKGKACLEYAKLFEEIVGKITEEQRTSEFYEPPQKARIETTLQQRTTG